jgi:L-ascorbate metabolism protein UlaG (beta-lactamase superfamily)
MIAFFMLMLVLACSECQVRWYNETNKIRSVLTDPVKTVFSTSMEEYDARKSAMKLLEAALNHCTPETFIQFYSAGLNLTRAEVDSWIEREPAFYYYEAAWDKIRREMETVQPDADSVIFWHVYNMGYIIKTAKTCFAIDLHHRRSEELIDKLDFLLITHDHEDHYTEKLLKSFKPTGKPLVSNFFPAPGRHSAATTLEFGPARIHLHPTDHASNMKNFVMTYEIELSLKSGKFIIVHSGDTFRSDQFKMKNPAVDVYIVHPRMGLDVLKVQKIIKPKLTLISHLQELHHHYGRWRWPYSIGLSEVKAGKTNGFHCAMPLWGDMIRLPLKQKQTPAAAVKRQTGQFRSANS